MILLGEFSEKLLRHIGLVRLDSASFWEVFFWIIPELIVFPTGLLVYFICRRLVRAGARDDEENVSLQQDERILKEKSAKVN